MPILVDVKARPDQASFKRAAGSMEKTFATAGQEAGAAFGKGFASGAKEVEAAAAEYRRAYDKVADTTGKAKTAEQELQRLRDKAKSQASDVEAAAKRVSDAREKEGKDSKAAAAAERELIRLKDQAAQTDTKIVRTSENIAKASRDQARQAREAAQAYRELHDAQQRAASSPGLFRSAGRGGANLASGAFSQSTLVSQFSGLGRGAGGAFIAGAAAAIVAGGLVRAAESAARAAVSVMKDVFEHGLNFERTFNQLKGVTRASAADMAQFRDTAKALGNDLTLPGVSSKDALEAMLELSKGGLDKGEVLKSVRGTLLLSTASGIAPGEAAEKQASVLQAFNLDASKADHVADLLTAVAQAAPGDIPDYALALQQAGTVAHGFGISPEDTLATLGMMFKAGIVGSDAGTSMKTLLTHLANPSDKASGAMAELGITPNDPTTGSFVGMRALIQQINNAGKRMRPDDFQRNVAELFGTDAIRGAMIASDTGPKMYDQVMAEFQHGGQAREMGAAMMEGWPGIVEKIHNGIDSIKMSLFDLFRTPAVQKFGDNIVKEIDKIGQWVGTHKGDIAEYFGHLVSGALRGGQGLAVFASFGIKTMAAFQQVTGRALGTVIAGLSNFGTFAGGIIKHIPGFKDLGKALEEGGKKGRSIADGIYSSGNTLTKLGDGIYDVGKTLGGWADNVDRFTDGIAKSFALTDAVGQEIKQMPDGTLTIKDNTPEVRERLSKLGMEVKQMPDGSFAIIPKTDDARKLMAAFRAQENGTPLTPPVKPQVDMAAVEQAREGLRAILGQPLQPQIQPTPGPPGGNALSPPFLLPPTGPPRALGGIFEGLRSFAYGKLPKQAMIQPASGAGLVQWAEDSTGGESFIPLNGGRRSIDIWAQTGRLLGVFDEGGIRGYGNLYRVAAAMSGGPYVWGSTDCSGAVSKIVNAAVGGSGRMSTATAAQWLAERGFQFGQGPPGTLRIGWHNGGPGGGHMAATLPDGTHFESGGSHGGTLLGGGAAGAEDAQFDQHAYLPMQALYPDGPGGGGGFGAMGYGSGGGGYFEPANPSRVRDAEQRVTRADQRVAELEQRQHELKKNASESERMRLEHQLQTAREEAQDARTDLETVKQGKYHAGRSGGSGGSGGGLGGQQLGASLDQDFGMSQGLPGLAKNLTMFLANLAFAPALGALGAVTSAFGSAGPGSGLLGMMAGPSGGGGAGGGYGGYQPGGSSYMASGGGLNAAGLGPDAAAAMAARGGGIPGAVGAPGGIPGAVGTPGGAIGGAGGIGTSAGGASGLGVGSGFTGGGGGQGGPGAAGASFTRPSSVVGGQQMGGSPGGGGFGLGGGLIGLAESAIPSALSAAGAAGGMMAPGAGAGGAMAAQAAQIGIDEINRAVGFAGQAMMIGASGLLETFSLNDSPFADPSKSWLGKLAVGFSGARPAAQNMAGLMAPQPGVQPPDASNPNLKSADQPGQGDGQDQGQGPGGVTVNYYNQSPIHTEDRAGKDVARQMAQYGGPR